MRSVYCLFIWMFTLYYKTIKLKSNETKHHSKKIQGILQTKLNSSGALPAIHLYVLSIFKINFVICCTFSRDPPSLKVDVTFVRGLSCLENVIVKCVLKYWILLFSFTNNVIVFCTFKLPATFSPSTRHNSILCHRTKPNRQLSWRILPARHHCHPPRSTQGRCSRRHWAGRRGGLHSSYNSPLLQSRLAGGLVDFMSELNWYVPYLGSVQKVA